MPPLPLENNLFVLSSEGFDGVVLLRHPHCCPVHPRSVLAPGALGVHLFPHGHSLHSVHDQSNKLL